MTDSLYSNEEWQKMYSHQYEQALLFENEAELCKNELRRARKHIEKLQERILNLLEENESLKKQLKRANDYNRMLESGMKQQFRL